MTRKEANLFILAKLTRYVNMNADQRFGQILRNIGVIIDMQTVACNKPGDSNLIGWVNHFNEESTAMLKRMEEREKQNKKEGLT